MATDMRARASSLKSQATTVSWNSRAATAFRLQADATANDLGASASTLDSAAHALAVHAAAVDKVKEEITAAERWVGGILDDAETVARNAVEVVKDVAEDALTGFMNILSSTIDGVKKLLHVSVFELFGQEIPKEHVERAKAIVNTVPRRPTSGSRDWLDLKSQFQSRGW
jgi:phage-related protein